MIPECLNPAIEDQYSNNHRKLRKNLFDFLKKMGTDQNNSIIIEKAKKIQRVVQHRDSRGSRYRGVSINGKAWQILIMVDK